MINLNSKQGCSSSEPQWAWNSPSECRRVVTDVNVNNKTPTELEVKMREQGDRIRNRYLGQVLNNNLLNPAITERY